MIGVSGAGGGRMMAVLGVEVRAGGIGRTNAELAGLQGNLKASEGAATRMGKQLAKGLKIAALGAAAGIAAAVKAAIDFDKEMRNVDSIAQLPERRFGKLREKVLALAGPTAQAPKTLAAGLYDLVSSGFSANESLSILAKSARAATAGLTTTEVSTKAVAAVLNAYHLAAGQAGDVSDVLFRTVERGVIEFPELAQTIGDVLPFASSLDVSLREVGASISTMTLAGISAPETMTRIKAVMVSLLKPSKDLKTAIKEQGYESGQAMINALGFQGSLDALAKSTGGSKEALAALFPNIRALGGALALTGKNSRSANEDLQAMQGAAGATARALSQQEKSTAFQLQQLKAEVEVLAIGFGQKLLPEINKVIQVITDPKLTTQQKFSKVFALISEGVQKAFEAATGLAAKYGPKIIGALASGMARAWTQMNPLEKLLSTAVLIRVLGGKRAIGATGAAIGRWLGLGIGSGAASSAALAIGGEGAGMAAGGAAGGLLGKIKGIKWGRVGKLGLGAFLADAVINEFGHYSEEHSADLLTSLSAKGDTQSGIEKSLSGIWNLFGGHGKIDAPSFSQIFGMDGSQKAAQNLVAQLEQLEHKRAGISGITQRQLEQEANELDLTKQQRKQLDAMFELLRQGRNLNIGVKLGMDPKKIAGLATAFSTLRSGVFTSMSDINTVVQRNAQVIPQLGLSSEDARDKMAENFRAAADAVGKAMDSNDISIKQGLQRQKELLRNAHLISGDDPFGIAKGFADSWGKAGAISAKQRQQAISDLAKMPPAFRQQAFDAMMKYGHGLVEGGKIPKQQFREFRSAVLAQFGSLATGVEGDFKNLSTEIGGALQGILGQVESTLQSLGVKVAVKQFALNHPGFTYSTKQSKNQRRQQGGMIVPGTGSGDTFQTQWPVGGFILNREATRAHGFNRGGTVPVALEPGERAFTPREVKAMGGLGVMEAMNDSVPRFHRQKGGGLSSPGLAGPAGPLLDIGRQSIKLATRAAHEYIAKHQPKSGGGGGIPSFSGEWVAVMQKSAKAKHWNLGDWKWIVDHESGGRVSAKNPTSTAFGLGQLLDGTYATYGGGPGSSGAEQIEAMARYLAARYGNPSKARAFWEGHNWYQRGGLVGLQEGGAPAAWRGVGPSGLQSGIHNMAGYLMGRYPGLSVSSTTGGTHADNSLHYTGQAVDLIGGDMDSIGSWVSGNLFRSLAEGIHNPTLSVKNGAHVASSLWGEPTWGDHKDHIHLGVTGPWSASGRGLEGGIGSKEAVPGVYHGARTKDVHFPSVPKNLRGIQHEIAHWQHELGVYRHAAALAKAHGMPKTQRAIEANSKAIENQLRKLRNARKQMRRQAARRKFTGHLGKQLGKVTGQEQTIEAAQRAYEGASQYAEQVVGLEPTEPFLPSTATDAQREAAEKGYVGQYEGYVEGQERPAYQEVLSKAADWRNSVIGAEQLATRKEIGWEGQIRTRRAEIRAIDRYTEKVRKDVGAWRGKGSGKMPDDLKREVTLRNDLRERLPTLRFQENELEKVLGEARGSFYGGGPFGIDKPIDPPKPPLAGTGSFEESLKDVQGLHWPGQHEQMAVLPANRVAGMFGGAIWDVQSSISELGLKIQQAQSGLGGGGTAEPSRDEPERVSLLEELARQGNQRSAVSEAQRVVLEGWDAARQGFAGFYVTGGNIPAGMWGIAGEQGPEPIAGPARVFSNREGRDMFGGGGAETPTVIVNGDIVQEQGDTRDPVEVVIGDRRFAPAVQKAARQGRPTGARTPGTGARR